VLTKRGEKRKNWKTRFFVLWPARRSLEYYAKSGGGDEGDLSVAAGEGEDGQGKVVVAGSTDGKKVARLMGVVQLRHVTGVEKCTDTTILEVQPNALELREAGRIWYLAAASDEERQAWIAAIQACIPPPLHLAATFTKLSDYKKVWNERYFLLDPVAQTVSYFEKEGTKCRGDIRFSDITIAEALPAVQFPGVANPFRIATDDVEWTLSSEDAAQREKWLKTLRQWVGNFKRMKKGKAADKRLRMLSADFSTPTAHQE
jgi:hypothetical protein